MIVLFGALESEALHVSKAIGSRHRCSGAAGARSCDGPDQRKDHRRQRSPHELRSLSTLACPGRAGLAGNHAVQQGQLLPGRGQEPEADPGKSRMAGGPALGRRSLPGFAPGRGNQIDLYPALHRGQQGARQDALHDVWIQRLDGPLQAVARQARRSVSSRATPTPREVIPIRLQRTAWPQNMPRRGL